MIYFYYYLLFLLHLPILHFIFIFLQLHFVTFIYFSFLFVSFLIFIFFTFLCMFFFFFTFNSFLTFFFLNVTCQAHLLIFADVCMCWHVNVECTAYDVFVCVCVYSLGRACGQQACSSTLPTVTQQLFEYVTLSVCMLMCYTWPTPLLSEIHNRQLSQVCSLSFFRNNSFSLFLSKQVSCSLKLST